EIGVFVQRQQVDAPAAILPVAELLRDDEQAFPEDARVLADPLLDIAALQHALRRERRLCDALDATLGDLKERHDHPSNGVYSGYFTIPRSVQPRRARSLGQQERLGHDREGERVTLYRKKGTGSAAGVTPPPTCPARNRASRGRITRRSNLPPSAVG